MKKYPSTCVQLLLVVLLTSFGALQAQANEPIPTDQISPCDAVGEWTLMSQKDGVSIFFSTISCDESYLAIKFENTNANSLDLTWSLTRNSEGVIITEDEMQEARIQLDSNGVHIFKGTYLIEVKDENDLSNFSVSIQTLKN